ncbi:endo-1,4-beta-xylanase [Nocardioides sp. CER19]|uniref:endo-1,4-beta-xylanase n=1 Tax=Nocardioides sp. CER19 TaxID=3038538 RepID=UPI00244709D0|nr:endo-1,4-beta-xylanase [Nocardioides sp. CER19]MDH2415310.1 endo-1,4-beta-xylanase [Nocardioides sp. CER19]
MTTPSVASCPTTDAALAHRVRATTVTVRNADGTPAADTVVAVEQVRHAFGLGNIGFDFVGLDRPELDRSALAVQWLDVYNTATLPFYWGDFEPSEGAPGTEPLMDTARWFAEHGVRVKGHPLVWHTLAPAWLRERSVAEVETAVRRRIERDVSAFAGVVDDWDVINEVVIMPVFDNEAALEGAVGPNAITRLCRERGRIATVRLAFEEARAANPAATLLINDFDLSTAYECLIEGLLEAGIGIDAIGLQSHMHQGYWGEERTHAINERFARYGLPLHWTETTLLSGDLMPPEIDDLNDYQPAVWPSTPEGEERQADEILRHYRTLASHPAVDAVTYWGLTDDGMWLGAPGGLVRADGSPKPAYDALRRLVKEDWWVAPAQVRTDADGRLTVRGWAGDYRVGDATVTLAGGDAEVRLR